MILLAYLVNASAQTDFEINPALDIYGLDLSFEGKIFAHKCDCCCSEQGKPNTCELYKVKVNRVIFHRDTAVYKNVDDLLEIKYVVLPSAIIKTDLKINKTYSIIGYNSCSEKFIIIKNILIAPLGKTPYYTEFPFFTGLVECKKFNLLQKICLSLNISREKIYSKATKAPACTSKFFQEIEKNELKQIH